MGRLFALGWVLQVAVIVSGSDVNFQGIINEVNSEESTWVAGHNFDSDTTFETLQRMTGVMVNRNSSRRARGKVLSYDDEDIEVPATFDARKHWKKCKTIKAVSDQGACGSSWALVIAETFTDRLCVATKGKVNIPRSAEEMLTCCEDCYVSPSQCAGGLIESGWEYVAENGLATGGGYKSHTGCQPYTIAPCEHTGLEGNMPNCKNVPEPTPPACQRTCTNKNYKKEFIKDHHYIRTNYYLNSPLDAQKDIMQYGSAAAVIYAYEDFYTYKSGVYTHKTGKYVGGKAIRVIGWGVENGVDYWLAVNSWNTNWGEKGFFKIKRGTDECGIDANLMGCHVAK